MSDSELKPECECESEFELKFESENNVRCKCGFNLESNFEFSWDSNLIFIHVRIGLIVGRTSILGFSFFLRVGIGLSERRLDIENHVGVVFGWPYCTLGLDFRFEFDARPDRRSPCRLEFI